MKVLDHGFVELVEAWGSEERIVESARQSTQKGFLGWGPHERYKCSKCDKSIPQTETYSAEGGGRGHRDCWGQVDRTEPAAGDEKLLAFLYKQGHSTPFEFAGMTIEVQAPIFVFREWHRHRTQSYSEASARYAPLPDVNYVPTVERLMLTGGDHLNKQAASTGVTLIEADARFFQEQLVGAYRQAEALYQNALARGVPKELVRVILPVGRYSKMRASTDLWNWIKFLRLREAPNAQYEIRVYAEAVATLLAEKFPRTMALYREESSK